MRLRIRLLAAGLLALWAAVAIAVAAMYRPGGPGDIVVVLACSTPVFVAAAGIAWPAVPADDRQRLALVWLWIAAVLLVIPLLYGVASTLVMGGPRSLVPSAEVAYAGLLALLALSAFSATGLVHERRGTLVFERRSTWWTALLSVGLTGVVGLAFALVALVSDMALRHDPVTTSSRFGPTDPDLLPPLCDAPAALGSGARVTITAVSSEDDVARGRAVLEGRRGGRDEVWGASWDGPDGSGQLAYVRVGAQAWLNRESRDPGAPGTSWDAVRPDPFDLAGPRELTMDGPPHSLVNVPRGSLVVEDLGLEVTDGARARHCRAFVDGPTALSAFLPLRWLIGGEPIELDTRLEDWRGELDWWVFANGELGRASVEISGERADTGWDSEALLGILEAELEAIDRTVPVDVSEAASIANVTPVPALESAAP